MIDEIVRQLKDSGASFYISTNANADKLDDIKLKYNKLNDIIIIGSNVDGYTTFETLLEDDGNAFPNVQINGKKDLALLPYSSGTTGLPKGVMLSHYNLLANVLQICQPWSYIISGQGVHVLLGLQPFFHASGKVVTLCNSFYRGATVVTLPKFDYDTFLQTLEKYKVTTLMCPPPVLLRMSKDPNLNKYDLSSIKAIGVGSAPVALPVIQNMLTNLKITEIKEGYGMTEGTCVTTNQPAINFKYGTIGKLVSNTEAKIVDVSTGKSVDINQDGELWVRGPQVMMGYLNRPQATAQTLDKDGWLHTGDIARFDEDRHLYIVDRLKELIKFKGFQVAPAELESVLLSHPAVKDTAVIGVPDERAGELPKAYVVLKPGQHATQQQLIDYCAQKLAPYKKLRGGVEFVTEIPKSPSGKILRKNLKAALSTLKSKL